MLTLYVTYTNVGDKSIVFDPNSSDLGHYRISVDRQAFDDGKFEFDSFRDIHDVISLPRDKTDAPDESMFVSLAPEESYGASYDTSLMIKSGDPVIQPGNHVVSFMASTWKYPDNLIADLRKKLLAKGYLWTDKVNSIPMEFTVDENKLNALPSCFPDKQGN